MSDRNGRQMIEDLKVSRPDVAITVSRVTDSYASWHGDGPSPRDEGCDCYTWTVTASTVRHGELIEGFATLGESWYRPEDQSETAQEIGGYLPQMIDEALEDLG